MFIFLNKHALTNAMHNALMHECKKVISDHTSDNTSFKEARDKFTAAYENESNWFIKGKKDPAMSERDLLHKSRAKTCSGIRKVVAGLVYAGGSTMEQAQLIAELFDVYKPNSKGNVAEQSAIIRNLLEDLGQEPYQAAVTSCNLTVLVEQLKTQNQQVEEACGKNRSFSEKKVKAALQQARAESDKAFDEMREVLHALALINREEFASVESKWNACVDYYKGNTSFRKALRASKNKDKETTVTPEGENGKPTDSKPTEGKPADGKPTEGKPAEGKPTEGKPTEGKPAEGTGNSPEAPDKKPAEGEVITPVFPEKSATVATT